MSTELAYEASDEASESELLERSLSVWKGFNSIEWDDFAPTALDIHTACSVGHNEWVRSIILKGGDPGLDRRNRGGWTPLMYACYIGHDNIVNLLINAGCNMNMKNSKGHTPLMLAASCGNESVARTLVRKGAELELIDKSGWTALFHATYAGHQNFVAFLLEAGANKDAVEPSSGTTPFMEASAEGHEIIVQLLLQHGVNVNAKAHNGYMARSLALMNGHMKVVSLIDNNVLPSFCLRSEPGLDVYFSSSEEARPERQHPPAHNKRHKSKGPSIRDGPEAIARMIDRTRQTEPILYSNLPVPKGYVSFPVSGADKEETKMSYRDVTSPINPEDYKDSSGSRAMSDLDDFNDDSNAFTKTGAITIKSSSSSSGGLVAALGLSRESSLDSDDSHSNDQTATSSDNVHEDHKSKGEINRVNKFIPGDRPVLAGQNLTAGHWIDPSSEINQLSSINNLSNHPSSVKTLNIHPSSVQTPSSDNGNDNSITKQDNGFVSPLRDYLPLDSYSLAEIAAPEASEYESSHGKPQPHHQSAKPQPHHQSAKPQPHHQSARSSELPRDNMTQVEIVNRFLKNLTVNNPETSTGQNRWADDDDESSDHPTNDELNEAPVYPHTLERHTATTSEYEYNNNSSKRLTLSKHKDVGQRSNDNILTNNSDTDKITGHKKDVFQMFCQHQTEAERRTSKVSGCTKVSSNIQSQSLQQSNHHNNQDEHFSNQPRQHHPQLNHHHPLHNRHHHNSNSVLPEASLSNIKQTQLKPPSVSHTISNTEIPPPSIHNLPRDYFYSDIEPTCYFHQESTSDSSPIHFPTSIISQFDINSEHDNEPNLLFQLRNPLLNNSALGNADSLVSENGALASQVQTGNMNKLANHHIAAPHNVNQTEYKSHDLNFTQPPSSSSSPVQSVKSSNRKRHIPSQDNPPHSSVQATVIIPGHVTSQPVCSTIDWGLPGLPESQGPRDLAEILTQLGLTKYLDKFLEQDVDLQVFLSMTDNDLKELGVKLFGPRKKMTNAIARWHSNAPIASNSLELAYADKLEGEMQEMAIQLNQACENEERLKAQVLQEQQLRSVTESCLMEERASWEQTRQVLLNTKTKMRAVGDLTSRLRLCNKELRRHIEELSRELPKDNSDSNDRQVPQTVPKPLNSGKESCLAVREVGAEPTKKMDNVAPNVYKASSELFKKSEKYFKEMQQTLTSVVAGMDHVLKSTPTVGNIDKLRPQT